MKDMVWVFDRELGVVRGDLEGKRAVRLLTSGYDVVVDPSSVVPVPQDLAPRIDVDALRSTSPVSDTRRPISPGAERWLGVRVRVLDHGSVTLVDYMGTDESIVRAARVSTGSESKGHEDDRRLIRYLMRHGHSSPFEHVEISFHVRLPIFVARQWVRHRTAHLNEHSARYSVLRDEFYLPDLEDIAAQDASNRQGRGEPLPPDGAEQTRALMDVLYRDAYRTYTRLLEHGVARELARLVLPVSIYTEWYWKIDLHNLLHFLKLRLDPHAQLEIRRSAEVIAAIVRDGWPLAWEAFEDYILGQTPLSKTEADVIRLLGVQVNLQRLLEACEQIGMSAGERRDLADKPRRIGILKGDDP
jgi:thymidylate synthase (FAD)